MLPHVYHSIIQVIRCSRSIFGETTFEDCNDVLQDAFSFIPLETLRNIHSCEYEKFMRDSHLRCSKLGKELYERYTSIIEEEVEDPGHAVLLNVAEEYDLAPGLLARIILEQHFVMHPIEGDIPVLSEDITEMIKDSTLIEDERLAAEIFECVVFDNLYGPQVDAMKHSLGQEYELHLLRVGGAAGLTFCEEDGSRGKGYDKTPDIKLDNPVLVNGKAIFWIESKAMFASEEIHEAYLHEQYNFYCTRFGPGLVIYWLGFVDTILITNKDELIICDKFPSHGIELLPKVVPL